MSLPKRSMQAAGATAGNDLGGRQQARLQQVGGEVEAAAEVLARERCFQHPQRDIEGGQAVVGELCPRLMPALVHGGHEAAVAIACEGEWLAQRVQLGLGQRPADAARLQQPAQLFRSEEHTSELQSLMRISYAVFC